MDTWQFKEAADALAALKSAAPNAPETNYLDGYQKFLTGDYDGAVRALSAAAEAQPANGEVKSLEELAAAARDAIKDFREERSPHAVIHYAPEDAVARPYARDTVEAAYEALHADLGFEISRSRSGSSSIAPPPIWRRSPRCRWPRWRAPEQSRFASGRA